MSLRLLSDRCLSVFHLNGECSKTRSRKHRYKVRSLASRQVYRRRSPQLRVPVPHAAARHECIRVGCAGYHAGEYLLALMTLPLCGGTISFAIALLSMPPSCVGRVCLPECTQMHAHVHFVRTGELPVCLVSPPRFLHSQ